VLPASGHPRVVVSCQPKGAGQRRGPLGRTWFRRRSKSVSTPPAQALWLAQQDWLAQHDWEAQQLTEAAMPKCVGSASSAAPARDDSSRPSSCDEVRYLSTRLPRIARKGHVAAASPDRPRLGIMWLRSYVFRRPRPLAEDTGGACRCRCQPKGAGQRRGPLGRTWFRRRSSSFSIPPGQ
jgi:hypothetical protein